MAFSTDRRAGTRKRRRDRGFFEALDEGGAGVGRSVGGGGTSLWLLRRRDHLRDLRAEHPRDRLVRIGGRQMDDDRGRVLGDLRRDLATADHRVLRRLGAL